jgi:hypothetical protein
MKRSRASLLMRPIRAPGTGGSQALHEHPWTPVRQIFSTPGKTQRIDVGRVNHELGARCAIGDHDIAGMTVDVRVV